MTEIEPCVRDVDLLIKGLSRDRLTRNAVGTQYPQALRGRFESIAPNREICKTRFQCRNCYFVVETHRTNLTRAQNVTAQSERRIGRGILHRQAQRRSRLYINAWLDINDGRHQHDRTWC